MDLADQIDQSITTFIKKSMRLFSNERDLQMHLAIALANEYGKDNVDVEYFVPGKCFDKDKYVWKQRSKQEDNQDMRVDIVVHNGDEYVPIELKYKTKSVMEDKINRFGTSIKNVQLIKNQSAQDLGRYDFWRDVHRLELLQEKFPEVKNGISLFITNDKTYLRPRNEQINDKKPNCNNLYLCDNHVKCRCWINNSEHKYTPERPNFNMERTYDIKWDKTEVSNNDLLKTETFYYTIVKVIE